MRRAFALLVPAPWLSVLLWACWLMLNGAFTAGQVALGAVLGVAVPWLTERLRTDNSRPRRRRLMVRLAAVVLIDIVLASIEVARRILGPQAAISPRFVWLPLDLRAPQGIVVLSCIVTMTPGTLAVDLSDDRRHLLIHAFDAADEAALVAEIKARYEAPLREIFDGAARRGAA